MSTHSVDVIRIDNVSPCPGADRLDLIMVNGYPCVVGKGQFKVGDLAVFVEEDYKVDTLRPEFKFLAPKAKQDGFKRITMMKLLKGTVRSYGLLIPAPEGSNEGDNVMELLGVQRYEPPMFGGHGHTGAGASLGGESWPGPEVVAPHYDLENYKKYGKHTLTDDDDVMLTSKCHGCNARYAYHDGKMWCGSRTTWKRDPGTYPINRPGAPEDAVREVKESAWHKALAQNPWMEEWCRAHPGVVVYCECLGRSVQGSLFHYGYKEPDTFGLAVFDVLEDGKWVDNLVLHTNTEKYGALQKVPLLYVGKHNKEMIETLAEQDETFNGCGHIREGVVVKPVKEKVDPRIGRIALKYVSDRYLLS